MRLDSLKPLFIDCPESDIIAIILANRNSRFLIMEKIAPKNKVKAKAKAKSPKKTREAKLDAIAAALNPEDFLKLLEE